MTGLFAQEKRGIRPALGRLDGQEARRVKVETRFSLASPAKFG